MTSERKTRLSSTQQFWEAHLENWARSGLSQAEYCRQSNVSIKSFGYWKRKSTKRDFPVELIQLTPGQIFVNPSLRLHTASGYQIEIPDGFCRTSLKTVLQILREL